MPGVKPSGFVVYIICAVVLVALGYYIFRTGTHVTQFKQGFFRFMVGQETNLRTGTWEQVDTAHFRIKYLPIDKYSVGLVSEAAEDAYIKISQKMGCEPSRLITIVVYPDNASLAASFGWDKNEKALGVYWGGTIRILSPRAWLANLGQEERFMKEGPMVHEMAHLMIDEMSRGNYNRWWTEGVAQYTEREITGFEFSSPFRKKDDLYYYQLDNLEKNYDRLEQSVAYWESLQAVDYLVGAYGEDKIYEVLNRLSRGDTMARALESALGVDYATFSRNFYRYLED
ncbi:MAG TPA: peptidase MA family metallohydrolase [Syntrophomonadaceae bacterium]|nr:peptidase MA family metallohydrolase [Syntrophomonadaceae bacterium]